MIKVAEDEAEKGKNFLCSDSPTNTGGHSFHEGAAFITCVRSVLCLLIIIDCPGKNSFE